MKRRMLRSRVLSVCALRPMARDQSRVVCQRVNARLCAGTMFGSKHGLVAVGTMHFLYCCVGRAVLCWHRVIQWERWLYAGLGPIRLPATPPLAARYRPATAPRLGGFHPATFVS